MIEIIGASSDFFSDEATFHGVVNRYNYRIWGSQNPHVTCELEEAAPE
jgi:hypothetical protein